jgi:superfamily II DNA or RNA helicase
MTEKVTITKLNEVFIHLECDIGILYELEPMYTFEVPGWRFTPKGRAGIWDGKIKLLQAHRRVLHAGLHNDLCKKIESLGYIVDSRVDREDESITPEEIVNYVKALNLHSKGTPIEARDYQYHAIYTALKQRRQTILSPTGSGKSAIIYCCTRYILDNVEGKVLIIVPTTQLVHQMIGDFTDYASQDEYDIEEDTHYIMSGREKDDDKRIYVSTWQSIYKMDKSWYSQFDAIICDEVHLAKALSISSILEKCINVQYRLGFTGSLDNSKTNQLVIQGHFGPITKVTTTRELIDDGHLSEISIKCLLMKYNSESAKMVKHMDYQKEIDFIISHDKRNKFIRNLALSLTGNTLILYTYVEKHGDVLYEMLQQKVGDRPLFYVHGGVEAESRDEVRHITEMSDNAIIVASAGTFSTGVNIRRLHNIIFASPTKSVVRVLQSIGRGLRKADDKNKVVVYDIADQIHKTKSKQNYTYNHFVERLRIYVSQEFTYKITEVNIE